ncbi:PAS domain-containing sensor histidine kinase [Solemya velum gill symbiont]|uniref:PAS domain-containing sensor histidine kinase n=2 Tax=Solemya velum gill symbiont TaxID=2340 RepID=UPI0009981062|nr:ATP-binding protein [Solemya velum gill symbiont]
MKLLHMLNEKLRQLGRAILRYTPMSLFAAFFGLLAGYALWEVIDTVQKDAVNKIYDEQLQSNLDQRAREALIHFDHSVQSYETTIRLLSNHRKLANYLNPVYWFPDDQEPRLLYTDKQPNWLPEPERWKPLASPTHIMLLDTQGQIREEYRLQQTVLPEELLSQLASYISSPQTILTDIDGEPYLLAATVAEDAAYNIMGTLVMVVPVDATFLSSAQRGLVTEALTAVVDGATQVILNSSDPEVIGKGVTLDQLDKKYAVTTQSFAEYGGANSNLLFTTMIPKASVRELRRSVIALERRQRAIVAFSFIIFFSLLFMLVSNRLSRALKRLSDFSQRALGISQPVARSGNQLMVLEEWMKQFINLVREAREDMRSRHESEILEKEALTSAIMDASVDSIITTTSDGTIIDFNPTAEEEFDYSEDEVVDNLSVERLIAPESRIYFLNLFAECQRAKDFNDARSELVAQRSDGSRFPVEIAIQSIQLRDEVLFTFYFHDISERRRQENEIRALAAFPSESPSPILRIDKQGIIQYANQASEPLMAFWHSGRMQELPLEWRIRVAEALSSGEDFEREVKTEDAVYSIMLSPIPELEYVNLYARDVTETRLAEEEARRHQNELIHVCRVSSMGEMATGLAHELNQPLSAIINYANGAKRRFVRGASGEELLEPLENITAQATRAAQIIKWLRGLVERQSRVRQSVDVNEMIREVLSFMDFEIRKARLDVEFDAGSDLPPIPLDLVQVEQVILNLLRNAIDAIAASGVEGKIRISTRFENDNLVILIEDNGPGISEQAMEHLFEPFFSTKTTGMGMGLAISQSIIEEHDGRIHVSSGELGGATFRLSLPLLARNKQIA